MHIVLSLEAIRPARGAESDHRVHLAIAVYNLHAEALLSDDRRHVALEAALREAVVVNVLVNEITLTPGKGITCCQFCSKGRRLTWR